jgi:hypothetical protein
MADELELIPATVGNAFVNTEWIDDGYYNESQSIDTIYNDNMNKKIIGADKNNLNSLAPIVITTLGPKVLDN